MHVLVTGASSGIGRAVCERLRVDGHSAIGIARDFGKFPCDDCRFEAHEIDLADLDRLPDHLQTLIATYPALDAIVLNAGTGRFGALEQFSYDQIRALIDLNFTSHVFVARAFLPALKKGGRGHLVFMGSEASLTGTAQGSLYCATKFALRGLAQALRAECARAGVRVTLVNPGMVQSPFFDELDFQPGPEPDNYILPEDVAEVIVQALTTRDGTVLDEINLSPQKKVIEFGTRKKK